MNKIHPNYLTQDWFCGTQFSLLLGSDKDKSICLKELLWILNEIHTWEVFSNVSSIWYSFSVPSYGHYCGPSTHFKAKKRPYHPKFLFLLTPPTSLTSAQVLLSDSLVVWWQKWVLGALDLHCCYANDSNMKTVSLPRDWWLVSRVRD